MVTFLNDQGMYIASNIARVGMRRVLRTEGVSEIMIIVQDFVATYTKSHKHIKNVFRRRNGRKKC